MRFVFCIFYIVSSKFCQPLSNKLPETHIIFQDLLYAQIIEVFHNRYLLVQTLATTCLHHKLACQLMVLMHLQRSQHYLLVQWVSRYHLPMIKCAQAECLSDSMHPQICLESYRLNTRYQGFNNIMRRSWLRNLVLDGSSSFCQDCKNSINWLRSCALNFSKVDRFHQSGVSCQKGRIESSSGRRDNLARRTFSHVFTDFSIHKSKFDVSHGLVTERPFSCAPFESLNDTGLGSIDKLLVSFLHEWIID